MKKTKTFSAIVKGSAKNIKLTVHMPDKEPKDKKNKGIKLWDEVRKLK